MSTSDLSSKSPRLASELCSALKLSDAAVALLNEKHNARAFIEVLLEKRLDFEAVKVAARALPKLRAVEWTCACVRAELGSSVTPGEAACLDAAEKWVAKPDEINRRLALNAAQTHGFRTPAAFAAAAAGWSGGSIAPTGSPELPSKDEQTTEAVIAALALLSVRDRQRIREVQLAILQKGLEHVNKADPSSPPISVASSTSSASPSRQS